MKIFFFLLIAHAFVNIFGINVHAQSVTGNSPNQLNHLAGDYSFNDKTKVNEGLIPVSQNLTGSFYYDNEIILKAVDDDGPVLDSIVVESVDDNNNWIKDGIYKYGIEEEGSRINYKIYFLDEVTNIWKGFLWQAYEYDEQGRLIRDFTFESVGIDVKEKKLSYPSKTEHLYNYDSLKTVEKISYKRDYALEELIPDRKVVQVFDANDNLLKEAIFDWKTVDQTWFQFKEFEYAYDENGYQILTSDKSWDSFSGVEIGWKRMEFEFDAKGNLLTEIDYAWNYVSLEWVLDEKYSYKYLEEVGLNSKIGYRWNIDDNKWIQFNKIEYVHDSAGNIIKENIFYWDDSHNKWVNQDLREFQYDENGNRTFYALSNWNQELNDWIPSKKMEDSFDASSNQTLRSSYDWNFEENMWLGYEKNEYEFDENGNKLNEIFYRWIKDSNDWIENRKIEYVNDEYGYSTHLRIYDWNSSEDDWLFIEEQPLYLYDYDNNGRIIYKEDLKYFSKSEYAFDEAGRFILQKDFVWDETIDDWRLRVMYEYGFDEEGRMILNGNLNWMQSGDLYYGSRREWQYRETGQIIMESTYGWDNDSKDWVGYSKKEITYFLGVFKKVIYAKWDSEKNDWQNYLKETYYYPDEIVLEVIQTDSEENLKIYPNPADHSILVQLPDPTLTARLELFNMSGNKMLSVDVFQGEQVNVSRFNPGVYSYRIYQKQKIYTGKIVKK